MRHPGVLRSFDPQDAGRNAAAFQNVHVRVDAGSCRKAGKKYFTERNRRGGVLPAFSSDMFHVVAETADRGIMLALNDEGRNAAGEGRSMVYRQT